MEQKEANWTVYGGRRQVYGEKRSTGERRKMTGSQVNKNRNLRPAAAASPAVAAGIMIAREPSPRRRLAPGRQSSPPPPAACRPPASCAATDPNPSASTPFPRPPALLRDAPGAAARRPLALRLCCANVRPSPAHRRLQAVVRLLPMQAARLLRRPAPPEQEDAAAICACSHTSMVFHCTPVSGKAFPRSPRSSIASR